MTVYVDADACPVKQEVYRVAKRFGADRKALYAQALGMKLPSSSEEGKGAAQRRKGEEDAVKSSAPAAFSSPNPSSAEEGR